MKRLAYITGATSGIGHATAEKFAREGWNLVITGRRANRLSSIKEDLESQYGIRIHISEYDVRSPEACSEAVNKLPSEFKAIDLLVNNAGLARGLAPVQTGDVSDWEEMIDTNVKGLLYVTKAIAPLMIKRGEGQIINVCSTAGKEVYPMGNVYCATKHAVDALTKGMRLDLHTHGIRVGQVSPAHVEETEFAKVRFHGDEERSKIYDDFTPLSSSDVADAIYYMAQCPRHVNVQDILLMGTQQASSTQVDRSGRKYK